MSSYAIIFSIYFFSHIFLLYWMRKEFFLKGHANSLTTWFIIVMLVGLVYDNFIFAFGVFFPDNATYKFMNYPRFYAHLLILPFLILVSSLFVIKKLSSKKSKLILLSISSVCFLGLLSMGIIELSHLELVPTTADGMFRYTAVHGSPIVPVLANIWVLAMGVVMWIKFKYKILAISMLIVFTSIPLSMAFLTKGLAGLLSNAFEILFVLGLMYTEKFVNGVRLSDFGLRKNESVSSLKTIS